MLIFLDVINPTNLTNLSDLKSDFRKTSNITSTGFYIFFSQVSEQEILYQLAASLVKVIVKRKYERAWNISAQNNFFFFKCYWRTHSRVLFWGYWYPCFRFLVTSPLVFKARVLVLFLWRQM